VRPAHAEIESVLAHRLSAIRENRSEALFGGNEDVLLLVELVGESGHRRAHGQVLKILKGAAGDRAEIRLSGEGTEGGSCVGSGSAAGVGSKRRSKAGGRNDGGRNQVRQDVDEISSLCRARAQYCEEACQRSDPHSTTHEYSLADR